jgi:hypothetical protein
MGLHRVEWSRSFEWVEGQMDAEQYVAILEQGLLQIMEDSGIPEGDIIFQPDNDPKHTSRRAQI